MHSRVCNTAGFALNKPIASWMCSRQALERPPQPSPQLGLPGCDVRRAGSSLVIGLMVHRAGIDRDRRCSTLSRPASLASANPCQAGPLSAWQQFWGPPVAHPCSQDAMAASTLSIANALNLAAANRGARQLPCPLRQSSFHGSSVATCSHRPPFRGQQQGRRSSRRHATTVLASGDAPWANQAKARWGDRPRGIANKPPVGEAAASRPPALSWCPELVRLPAAG